MRAVLVFVLLVLSVILLLVAAGSLKNVWAAHPDGPRLGYLAFGLVAFALAVLPAFIAWRLQFPEGRRRRR